MADNDGIALWELPYQTFLVLNSKTIFGTP